MSKERLGFDAEREMKHLKKIVNKDDSLTLSSRFVKYLIQQAERVQELEETVEDYKTVNKELHQRGRKVRKQNKRYREAIEKIKKSPKEAHSGSDCMDIIFSIIEELESESE